MPTRLTVLFYRLRPASRAEGLDLRFADVRKQKLWGVGKYYVVCGNSLVNKDVNLETLAREMGLFESWEETASIPGPELIFIETSCRDTLSIIRLGKSLCGVEWRTARKDYEPPVQLGQRRRQSCKEG